MLTQEKAASPSRSAGRTLGKDQWLVLTAAFLGWMFDGVEMGLFPLLTATFLEATTSKEARHGNTRPPPRQTIAPPELATIVPLEQLWTRLPSIRRQELLGRLTQILAQRLAPPDNKEAADD